MSSASAKMRIWYLLQKELERLKAEFAKEREQFQTKIAAGERTNKIQQVLCVCMSLTVLPHVCV